MKMLNKFKKKAQEEMIGFAMIIIIVAVILLVFLSITISKPQESVQNYQVQGFLQSIFSYTTDCRDDSGNFGTIRDLIFDCDNSEICQDQRTSCEALNSTLTEIIEESWKVGEDRPVKGYKFEILIDGAPLLDISEGNITQNYKGAIQVFPHGVDITFNAYYE